jgi:predicted nucleotidyltransferase
MSLVLRELIVQIKNRLIAFDWVDRVILFGSYARGDFRHDSDVDLAVLIKSGCPCHLEQFKLLSAQCRSSVADIQIQMFSQEELLDPCGIIEEVLAHGIDITDM